MKAPWTSSIAVIHFEHCDGLIGEGNFEICLRHKGRTVEFFEGVGDAFGLREEGS
jgi:hypothetical protein